MAAADLAAACAAVSAVQARLRGRFPGLRTELLRRPGASDGEVTLMEVYELGAADADAVEAEAAPAAARWRIGARHVERFEPLG